MNRLAKYFIPAVQRFDLKFELKPRIANSDKYELTVHAEVKSKPGCGLRGQEKTTVPWF